MDFSPEGISANEARNLRPRSGIEKQGDRWTDLVERLTPAVARIETVNRGSRKIAAAGSGFVVREDGHIVTNAHVLAGRKGARYYVTLPGTNGAPLEAVVIPADAEGKDLALLKVPLTGLQPVEYADAAHIRAGEEIISFGHPFGIGRPLVKKGIVASVPKKAPEAAPGNVLLVRRGLSDDFIMTDMQLSRGYSGGPTFDGEGRVVGMNMAVAQDPKRDMHSGSMALIIPGSEVERFVEKNLGPSQAIH